MKRPVTLIFRLRLLYTVKGALGFHLIEASVNSNVKTYFSQVNLT